MSSLFDYDGFLFLTRSIFESISVMAILWACAVHFVKEDQHRSHRQKQRITQGTIAGLFGVLVFILPCIILKYAFGKDVLGSNRPLMMGIYEFLAGAIFAWVGYQVGSMWEDGVGAQKPQDIEMSGEKVQRPAPAKLDRKTLDTPEHVESAAAERFFAPEKRGLTWMHFITSSVSYFVFLEPYLYIMQFDSAGARTLAIPVFLALITAFGYGYALCAMLMKCSFNHCLISSFLIILAITPDLMQRSATNFVLFYNSWSSLDNKVSDVDSSKIALGTALACTFLATAAAIRHILLKNNKCNRL